ncbi:hypothetical protein I4U23_015298 [Adineta vaga]|nr:hypothetical protein I4U23_015298 [Adineta vaga]
MNIFVIRSTCINSIVDKLSSKSLSNQQTRQFTSFKLVNRISPQIRSCSKWNRTGETMVGEELNTKLNDLENIAIIGIDTLYIVDRYNDKTRLQVFPGDSLIGRTLWNELDSIVFIDENGTFYTTSDDGNITRWLENATEGEKINCQCNQCSRIWFDSEKQDFYIVERYRSQIIKCNSNTNITITIAGITDIDGSSNETLSYPYSLYKWTENTTSGFTVAGQTGKVDQSNATLCRPNDIIVDINGFLYIADTINHRILRWKEGESQGEVISGISSKSKIKDESGNSSLHLNRPKSLAFDLEGNLYVADVGNNRVQKFHIDNSACLLSEPKLSMDPWSLIRQQLYTSKVKLEKKNKLGLGYNPSKDSPICYTEVYQRKGFGLPIFNFTYSVPSKKTYVNKSIPENANIETQIIKTLRDLKESTSKIVDTKSIEISFSYVYARGIHFAVDMIIKDNSTILFTSVNKSSIHLSLTESTLELSNDFRYVIENMPCCEFNETVERYIREFIIGYFGYTYIRSLQLGSIVQQTIIIKENDRIKLEQNGFNTSDETCIADLLTNQYFPADMYISKKAILIKSVVDRYLSNPVYCYNQCTDTAHGTCVDSAYFQFGICKCKSGWTGFDCAIPIHHYIDTLNSSISSIRSTRAGRNSFSTSIGHEKGQMPSYEIESTIFDRNIYTKYTSFGSNSANVSSLRSGLNTGFYVTLHVGICIVTGFRFTTATDQPNRDPVRVTLEGSNADNSSLTIGKSWTLIYDGSSGLDIDPGRGKAGSLQMLNNTRRYRSYRVLVVSKRGIESGVHYSEFEFYGHSCLPETYMQTRRQGNYVTNANLFGSEGQTGVLLAPIKPFDQEIDYSFYFFGGPDILPPLINSFITANLPAIVAYVSANPLHLDLNKDTKLIIKQLDLTPQSIRCKSSYVSTRKTEQTKTNYSRWMSTPKIQSKTLSQLKIPGTHNSGSYGLTRKLSQITYGNIKFLWNLSADFAPANGQLPFSKDKIYVGRTLLDYIIDTTLRISISQNRTIRQQLDDGIRFFDFRVYYDVDGSFYIQHALRGPELNDILRQIRNFLDAHSTSGELIFLLISHTNFGIDPKTLPSRVTAIIQNHLKPYLYMPENSIGHKSYEFQNLKDVTLSSITTNDSQITTPKVIVLNTDHTDDYYYEDTVINTRGFADSGRWEIASNGVNSLTELIELESQGLRKNMKSMYHIIHSIWLQSIGMI